MSTNFDLTQFIGTSAREGEKQLLDVGIWGKGYVIWRTIQPNKLSLYAKGTEGLIRPLDTTITIERTSNTTAKVSMVGEQAGETNSNVIFYQGGIGFKDFQNFPFGISELWLKRDGVQSRISIKRGIWINTWVKPFRQSTGNTIHDGALALDANLDASNLPELVEGHAYFDCNSIFEGSLDCVFPISPITTLSYSGKSSFPNFGKFDLAIKGVCLRPIEDLVGMCDFDAKLDDTGLLTIRFVSKGMLVGYFEGQMVTIAPINQSGTGWFSILH